LPKLIESLSNPGISMPEFEPLAVSGQTELAELGEALNSLQSRAVTVANEQQRVVKQGISELVVNLARRNQSLLDRQIENIDALESTEEDPDRLESLFRLDHLATRMRRNAESLLVLSGAEPSRRRGGPVVLADVIRVAMSEIEDYQKVSMGDVRTAHIGPQGAVDVAHLMSELLENATQFSPPDAPVSVSADFDVNGFYEILIEDRGIGMSAEQLLVANQTILEPPELGLALTRSLGFQVIGRLAERLGVTVHLSHTEGGGTTASVMVPGEVLSSGAAANVPAAFQSMPTARRSEPQIVLPVQNPLGLPAPSPQPTHQSAPSPEPAPQQIPRAAFAPESVSESPWADEAPSAPQQAPAPQAFDQPAPAPRPAPQQAPAPQAFDQPAPAPRPAPQQAPAPQPFQQPAPAPRPAPQQDGWSAPQAPDPAGAPASMAQAMPTGNAFDQGMDALLDDPDNRTNSGLVRRDRSQNHAPQSEGRSIPGANAAPAATASNRSPEEIRNMLARYRDGLKSRPDAGQDQH
jgi:two-component sensor histidine kinase